MSLRPIGCPRVIAQPLSPRSAMIPGWPRLPEGSDSSKERLSHHLPLSLVRSLTDTPRGSQPGAWLAYVFSLRRPIQDHRLTWQARCGPRGQKKAVKAEVGSNVARKRESRPAFAGHPRLDGSGYYSFLLSVATPHRSILPPSKQACNYKSRRTRKAAAPCH